MLSSAAVKIQRGAEGGDRAQQGQHHTTGPVESQGNDHPAEVLCLVVAARIPLDLTQRAWLLLRARADRRVPWPTLTTALWVAIALAGLWLGLLGIAMATGLAIVMRSGAEIPEDYWRSILDYDYSANVTRPQRL